MNSRNASDKPARMILLAGAPGTGKTTFARYLSARTGIAMASKDAIKERLFDTVGFRSRDEKNALGVAAAHILLDFARAHLQIGLPVILESNFETVSKPALEELLTELNCEPLTVLFWAEAEALYRRVLERDRSPQRHRGHVVNTQYPEVPGKTLSIQEQHLTPEQFNAALETRGMLNFSVGGQRMLVDTTDFAKVSYPVVLDGVKRYLGEASE